MLKTQKSNISFPQRVFHSAVNCLPSRGSQVLCFVLFLQEDVASVWVLHCNDYNNTLSVIHHKPGIYQLIQVGWESATDGGVFWKVNVQLRDRFLVSARLAVKPYRTLSLVGCVLRPIVNADDIYLIFDNKHTRENVIFDNAVAEMGLVSHDLIFEKWSVWKS